MPLDAAAQASVARLHSATVDTNGMLDFVRRARLPSRLVRHYFDAGRRRPRARMTGRRAPRDDHHTVSRHSLSGAHYWHDKASISLTPVRIALLPKLFDIALRWAQAFSSRRAFSAALVITAN